MDYIDEFKSDFEDTHLDPIEMVIFTGSFHAYLPDHVTDDEWAAIWADEYTVQFEALRDKFGKTTIPVLGRSAFSMFFDFSASGGMSGFFPESMEDNFSDSDAWDEFMEYGYYQIGPLGGEENLTDPASSSGDVTRRHIIVLNTQACDNRNYALMK